MRIAVDTRALCVPVFGIGRYTGQILFRTIPAARDIEWFLYADRPLLADFSAYDNVTIRQFGHARRFSSIYRSQHHFSRWARQDRIDTFWSPRHHLPVMLPSSIRQVLTIHDLVWKKYPETMKKANLWLERALMPVSMKKADAILCVSRSTARDVLEIRPRYERKIFVTPLAADTGAKSVAPDITGSYLLFVGTLEPRKNLSRIVQAFQQALPLLGDIRLVLVGARGWGRQIEELIRTSELASRVVLTGHLDDEALNGYYEGATALLLPSLYEGFGIPALEAMTRGVPVIGADNSSLPEVIGDGGILVDPLSVDRIAEAMIRLVNDPEERARLANKAREQAGRFSWDRTAAETLAVLKG